jgi:hypothetical protein
MNLKQFIAALRKTKRNWHVRVSSLKWGGVAFPELAPIRNSLQEGGSCCPITALKDRPCSSYQSVGERLGIPDVLISAIANAADNKWMSSGIHHESNMIELRKLLLNACGIS